MNPAEVECQYKSTYIIETKKALVFPPGFNFFQITLWNEKQSHKYSTKNEYFFRVI